MATSSSNSALNDILLLIARLPVAVIFLLTGYNQATHIENYNTYFGKVGIPMSTIATPIVFSFEILAGLSFLIGFKLRYAALGIAAFCIGAALLAHTNFADANQMNHFLKNFALAGGMLAFFVVGAGAYSLDGRSKS